MHANENQTPELPELLTVDDLAEALHLHPISVRRMELRGEIPGAIRIGRRALRFRKDAIVAMLGGHANGAIQ